MKGLVVFKGRYGSTEEYANWIAEDLGFGLACSDDIKKKDLENYDVLVIGSSVYTGRLRISEWLEENREILLKKPLYLFTVSGTHPTEDRILQRILNLSVPEEMHDRYRHYPLHGRLVSKKLTLKDRFFISFGSRISNGGVKPKGNPLRDYDYVARDSINAMVEEIRRNIEA